MTYLDHCERPPLIEPALLCQPMATERVTVSGTLETITDIGSMAVVSFRMDRRLAHAPGQFLRVVFEGHSARAFSFSAPLDGHASDRALVLHIWREQSGAVSNALGDTIRPGHRIVVHGPFGDADHLLGETPLSLVGECASFGKLWSIARWSLRNPMVRPVTVHLRHESEPCSYARTCLDLLRVSGVEVSRFETVDQLRLDADCVVAGSRSLVDDVAVVVRSSGRRVWHDPLDLDRTGRARGQAVPSLRTRVVAAWRGVPPSLVN